MKAWLFVGAKVVCVDADATALDGMRYLVEGQTYTIAEVVTNHERTSGPYGESPVTVYLVEPLLNMRARPFAAERFRPVSTIDTTETVAALKRLVAPNRQTEKV